MYKSLLISALCCLFLFTSGFAEKSSRRYDPLDNCTEAMKQKETADKLAKCPSVSWSNRLYDPVDCCQYWKGFTCERDILYTLPQCQSSRFLIEMQVNLAKPADSCLQPPPSCANVTNNRAITTVTEDLFRPIDRLYENATYQNCTNDIKESTVHCMLQFDGLLDGRQAHKDGDICCDELAFKDCSKKITDSKASCLVAKTELDSLYKMIEAKVEKKCPGIGSHCHRNCAPNLS